MQGKCIIGKKKNKTFLVVTVLEPDLSWAGSKNEIDSFLYFSQTCISNYCACLQPQQGSEEKNVLHQSE